MEKPDEKIGIVLEGGGMRGVYTAGVLDFLQSENFFADGVIGVSAGAVQAVNYVSSQPKRGFRVIANYANDKRYMSFRSFLFSGDLFNKKFCYEVIPNALDPFDYDAFVESPIKCFATVTNVLTGEAEHLELRNLREDMDKLRASGSLPLVSRLVSIDGVPHLDGGIADSIPYEAFRRMGYGKCIVVLTRAKGYRKNPNKLMPLIRWKYRRYPRFVEACANRYIEYNRTLENLEAAENRGEVFVIRPERTVEVARLEKNVDKLKALYDEGYAEAKSRFEELKRFVGK